MIQVWKKWIQQVPQLVDRRSAISSTSRFLRRRDKVEVGKVSIFTQSSSRLKKLCPPCSYLTHMQTWVTYLVRPKRRKNAMIWTYPASWVIAVAAQQLQMIKTTFKPTFITRRPRLRTSVNTVWRALRLSEAKYSILRKLNILTTIMMENWVTSFRPLPPTRITCWVTALCSTKWRAGWLLQAGCALPSTHRSRPRNLSTINTAELYHNSIRYSRRHWDVNGSIH